MTRIGLWLARQVGSAARILIVGILTIAIGSGVVWAANYTLTQGAGTTFGSVVVAGVNYAQQFVCDLTTPGQCVAVDASGGMSIKGEGTAGSASGGVLSVNVVSNTGFPTPQADPCGSSANVKQTADFVSASSGGSIITATPSAKAYVCSLSIVTSQPANVSLIEGTGAAVCTGGTTNGVFMNTGVTVASGASFAANSGITVGNGGYTVAKNATANQNICVAFTTANAPTVNAHVTFVQQ